MQISITCPGGGIMQKKILPGQSATEAVLKDTAIKDWQDPYHQECPMKW